MQCISTLLRRFVFNGDLRILHHVDNFSHRVTAGELSLEPYFSVQFPSLPWLSGRA